MFIWVKKLVFMMLLWLCSAHLAGWYVWYTRLVYILESLCLLDLWIFPVRIVKHWRKIMHLKFLIVGRKSNNLWWVTKPFMISGPPLSSHNGEILSQRYRTMCLLDVWGVIYIFEDSSSCDTYYDEPLSHIRNNKTTYTWGNSSVWKVGHLGSSERMGLTIIS